MIVSPLYKLLKKDSEFKWTVDCETAFNQVKACLVSPEVLTHFEPSLPIKVTCDAVLSHILLDSSERPVAFISRTLSKAEQNYAQIDREALSIVFAVKRFHQYLFGFKFKLETDLKPLIYIFEEKKVYRKWQRVACKDGQFFCLLITMK